MLFGFGGRDTLALALSRLLIASPTLKAEGRPREDRERGIQACSMPVIEEIEVSR